MLLEALRPQLVVLSVAKVHLKRIEFAPLTEWEAIHAFERTGRRAQAVDASRNEREGKDEPFIHIQAVKGHRPDEGQGPEQRRGALGVGGDRRAWNHGSSCRNRALGGYCEVDEKLIDRPSKILDSSQP